MSLKEFKPKNQKEFCVDFGVKKEKYKICNIDVAPRIQTKKPEGILCGFGVKKGEV